MTPFDIWFLNCTICHSLLYSFRLPTNEYLTSIKNFKDRERETSNKRVMENALNFSQKLRLFIHSKLRRICEDRNWRLIRFFSKLAIDDRDDHRDLRTLSLRLLRKSIQQKLCNVVWEFSVGTEYSSLCTIDWKNRRI